MTRSRDIPGKSDDASHGEPQRAETEREATATPSGGETPGEPAPEGTRIATLLLSDLVGSSALVERTGDVRSAELFQKHDRVARDLLEQHDGREIDKTDGFLLLFDLDGQNGCPSCIG